jgi:cytochrome b pre-mRNA-processing protein 3
MAFDDIGNAILSCIGAGLDLTGHEARSIRPNAMISPLFRRPARPDTISTLYGMIVAQARLPGFYRDLAVPDTVKGRFELIVLHLALLLDRFADERELRALGQGVFDRFCQDMDHNLREMGVGDLAVPKQMRRVGEAFYGRAQAYRAALAAVDDEALVETVARNIYGGTAAAQAQRLAAYMREAVRQLKALGEVALMAGAIVFPEPVSAKD